MRNSKTKKLLAFVLALIMLVGSALPVFAADATAEDAGTSVSLQELKGEYTLMSYEEYKSKYNYSTDDRAGEEITLAATDYLDDPEYTDAEITVDNVDGKECILVGNAGSVSWEFDIPKTGWYCIRLVYRSATDVTTDIERILEINGKTPYQEARYQDFAKTWTFDYLSENGEREGAFELDIVGNELRPDSKVYHTWTEYSVKDSDGYYPTPLEFYFQTDEDDGENGNGKTIITLDSVRDDMYISEVGIYSYEELPSYEEIAKGYEEKGYKAAESAAEIKLEAEMPDYLSNYTIYPVYD
ncbi:MAG: hypothetical protein IKZ03_05695, partial [Clostridia bacterium]|nr:hypothetical protein [Clostridia bacterium]